VGHDAAMVFYLREHVQSTFLAVTPRIVYYVFGSVILFDRYWNRTDCQSTVEGAITMKILEIQNLVMYYKTMKGYVKAVDNVSFDVEKGEAMGLVGESGCGKTTIGMSILRLLPSNAEIQRGSIYFRNEDILQISEKEMRTVRWKGVSMIFQAAMNALNPVHRIEDQIIEAIRTHDN
jgi:ABC-type glutathione transport system ATPase component